MHTQASWQQLTENGTEFDSLIKVKLKKQNEKNIFFSGIYFIR